MPKAAHPRQWIAPTILAGIGTLAIIISSLLGHWNEWWVKWGIIPASLLAGAFGIYEFLTRQRKRSQIWAIVLAGLSFVLIGGGVVAAYKVTYGKPTETVETRSVGWLPPELPPECTNVSVSFGTQTNIFPIWLAEIQHDESGTNYNSANYFKEQITPNLTFETYEIPTNINLSGTTFAIKDLPSFFGVEEQKFPDYSPRNRHVTLTSQSFKNEVGGKQIDFPVWPFVVSNRLFVDVEIPFINERHRLLMDTNFESKFSKLPRLWDINYSSNRFELVNEDTKPILQVIYVTPREVHVNGLYVIGKYDLYEAFDSVPSLIQPAIRLKALQSTQEIQILCDDFGKVFTNAGIVMNTNLQFRTPFAKQKAIFKYPSYNYLGQLAN